MLPWIRKRLPLGRPRNLSRSRPQLEPLEDRLVLSPPGSGWQLLWSDEFNGTSLDTSKWAVATGTRRDAVNTASAVSESGGNLTITTYTSGGTNYTGFIGTSSGFKATYGYWEARINFQDSPGMWSAFWEQSPTIGNPLGNPAVAGTEIDNVEHRYTDGTNNISNKAESNLHWDGYGTSEKNAGSGLENNPGGTSLQGNFHLYAVQWSPSGYQFYIDGTQVWSTTQGVSQRSEFIYLTSEVQNNSWAGSIPSGGYGSLSSSQTKMQVDYVRVYQKPVSAFADVATTEGTATAALPFQVTQQDGRTTTVSATSSNTALVPAANLTLGGSGANRTLTVTPATGQTGTATVTVNANNGVVSGSSSFTLTVNAGSFHNGGFEDSPLGTGWSLSGTAQVVNFNQRSGGHAMRMNGAVGAAQQVVTGLSPNTTYVLGGWDRVSYPTAVARLGVKNYGGNEVWVDNSNTGYTNETVTFTTGPTSTQATVYVSKPVDGNAADFDDLSLFRGPNQLADPGFETPSVGTGTYGAFQYQPAGSPWTFNSGAGVAGNGSGFTDGNPSAPQGSQVAFLQGYGTASQPVTFTAGTYSLSFLAAQRGNYQYSSQTIQVLVDGNVVGTFTPPDTNYSAFTTGSFSIATGGPHTITLAGTDPDGQDNTAFIDAVQINQVVPVVGDAGFETVNVGSGSGAYQYDPTGSAWTFTGGAGVSANNTDFTGGNPAAPEGSQVAFLQGTDAAISQSVTFAAGTYSVGFSAAQRGNGNASSQSVQVYVDGTLVGTFTPGGPTYTAFTTDSFTVTAGAHTVSFVAFDQDGLDNTAFIDQVQLLRV